jgi:hypothetical protein
MSLRADELSLPNRMEGSTHRHGDCSQEENAAE